MISASDRPRSLAVLLAALLTLSLVAGLPGASGQATFDGEVNVSLTPASDGTSAQWSLSDYDSASNVSINITGEQNTQWDNISASGVPNGGSVAVEVAGNLNPNGPSTNGEPVLKLTGVRDLESVYANGTKHLKIIDSAGNVVDTGQKASSVGGMADIDADGDLDIVYADESSNLKYVDSAGNVVDTGQQANSAGGIGDIDGNGDLDIVYADGSSNLKFVDSGGKVVDTGQQAKSVGGIGDIDSDGDLDIVYADNPGGTKTNLKYVDSAGNVVDTNQQTINPGGIGDIDADGDLDIIYADGSYRMIY